MSGLFFLNPPCLSWSLLRRLELYGTAVQLFVFSSLRNDTGFLIGDAGVLAVAAVIAKDSGRLEAARRFAQRFAALAQVAATHGRKDSDELLVGRAGYISGALWINKQFQQQVQWIYRTCLMSCSAKPVDLIATSCSQWRYNRISHQSSLISNSILTVRFFPLILRHDY